MKFYQELECKKTIIRIIIQLTGTTPGHDIPPANGTWQLEPNE